MLIVSNLAATAGRILPSEACYVGLCLRVVEWILVDGMCYDKELSVLTNICRRGNWIVKHVARVLWCGRP